MAKKKDIPKGSAKLANPKHELFVWLYAGHHNRELFGNGTRCYMQAYGYNDQINKLQKEIDELMDKKEKGYSVAVSLRERRMKGLRSIAGVEASGLLAKPSIRQRCDFLMMELFTNDFMDAELVFTAGQRFDLASKVAAIREFNRVKDRGSNKLEGEFTIRWGEPETGKPKK